jgi:hypothetical protein
VERHTGDRGAGVGPVPSRLGPRAGSPAERRPARGQLVEAGSGLVLEPAEPVLDLEVGEPAEAPEERGPLDLLQPGGRNFKPGLPGAKDVPDPAEHSLNLL